MNELIMGFKTITRETKINDFNEWLKKLKEEVKI
jgi:hypothetical protein